MYTLGEIISQLNLLAPAYLAEKWDNIGLLVGSRQQEVGKVLCALDINLQVVEEAIEKKVDCIITHHPFIFKPIARIDFDTPKGNMLKLLIQNNIAVYSMHTNWDIAEGGINDLLGDAFGLENTKPIEMTYTEHVYKLAIYVPKENVEAIREVLIAHNPCEIGHYKGCTFAGEGTGSFVPLEGSKPYIGEHNQLELLEEVKIECMVYLKDVDNLMKQVGMMHPYEDIAYDLYPLENLKTYQGIGRHGQIEPILLEELVAKAKKIFGISYIRLVGHSEKLITRLSICSGSGSEYIGKAASLSEVYITADVKFHEAQAAMEQGLVILDVGHYASENIAMPFMKQFLQEKFMTLEIDCSEVNGEVFQTI